jgi:hypothetical protein
MGIVEWNSSGDCVSLSVVQIWIGDEKPCVAHGHFPLVHAAPPHKVFGRGLLLLFGKCCWHITDSAEIAFPTAAAASAEIRLGVVEICIGRIELVVWCGLFFEVTEVFGR